VSLNDRRPPELAPACRIARTGRLETCDTRAVGLLPRSARRRDRHSRPWLFAASFLSARETTTSEGDEETQAAMAEPHHSPEGSALNAAISKTVVRLMADASGRGPTKARTTIDRDLVVVVLQNSLTSGERYLAHNGRTEHVLETRRAYQDAMSSDCITSIEDLTGRTVLAFMSANHIDPDLAAEVFILKPEPSPRR
jgi:uncharacterized protein YbcI